MEMIFDLLHFLLLIYLLQCLRSFCTIQQFWDTRYELCTCSSLLIIRCCNIAEVIFPFKQSNLLN